MSIDTRRVQRLQSMMRGGQPLPNEFLDFFEPRFDNDFGDVRIHTGPAADEAARSLQAAAFTFGRNVVFKSGTYDPSSPRGAHLLAHELTHVVQQRGDGAPPIPRGGKGARIAPADGRLEREAARTADTVMRPGGHDTSPASPTVESIAAGRGPAIQRQPEGVRISSPVVDETLRQAGAVSGAIGGRPLAPNERELAASVFDQSIDYDRVRIATAGPTWTTSGNVIFVPSDFSVSDGNHASVFIHEMAHVWQYQHGGSSYISTSLGRQLASYVKTAPLFSGVQVEADSPGEALSFLFSGSRHGAYEYDITTDASIFDYMPEQQAQIVQTYFILRRRKAQLEAENKPIPAELRDRLDTHEQLVMELTRALPRSETELLEESVRRATMQPLGGESGPLAPPQAITFPLLEIKF